MSKETQIALMQALDLPAASQDEVPEWIHLLPSGPTITTIDGRGPYSVVNPVAVVQASLHGVSRLPIDENHAIDIAAPRGEASPARGHIVELAARDDGIWGRVEWTRAGRELIADRAYGGISPVIIHDRAKKVLSIARASLVNRPNLRGLTALHQEETMSLEQRLAELLGMGADATEDALIERITSLHAQAATPAEELTALQSQVSEIGVALGVTASADADAVLAAARAARTGQGDAITALQSELASVGNQLQELREATARERATAFVDAAIQDGRVSVKPLRDHYIAMHMQDPARVEKEIAAMPSLKAGGGVPPQHQVSLHMQQPADIVARARVYQKKQAEAGIDMDWPSAVRAIEEGKQ